MDFTVLSSEIKICTNTMAIVILLGMIVFSKRIRSRNNAGDRLFLAMIVDVIIYALLNVIQSIVIDNAIITYEKVHFFLMILNAFTCLWDILVLLISYRWLLYVGYIIYGSADYLRRRYWPFLIPIPILSLLLMINMFTNFMYGYDLFFEMVRKPVYYIIPITEGIYILSSAFLVWKNNRKADRMHMFHFEFVLFPVVVGFLFEYMIKLSIVSLCFAAALAFIYFSMTELWQFDDEEKGFYNSAFFDYMKELAAEGRNDYTSAVYIRCNGVEAEMASIIHTELPREVVKVHVRKNVYGIYAEKGKDDLMDMIVDVIKDGVSEYEKEHGISLEFEMETEYRNSDESAAEFLERIEVR